MSQPTPTPALRSAIERALEPLPYSGEDALHPLVKESMVERTLAAVAPFLAPAPVEQARGWNTGTPDVKEGGCETFWCCFENDSGKHFHRHLDYANRHIMPLADGQDETAGMEPVPNSDEDFYWTGWHEVACDQCDTQWRFSQRVVAWMRLPRFAHFQSLAAENKDSALEWLFERGEVTLGRSEDGNVMLSWRDKAYYGDTVEEAAIAARASTGKGDGR